MAEDQEEDSIFDEIGDAIEKVTRRVFRKKNDMITKKSLEVF